MPRVCTVCTHPRRHEIDECLVSGQSNRGIAKRIGLDDAAVFRHRNAHLPAEVAKAHEAREVARADDLLAQVRGLHDRALALLDRAERDGKTRDALLAIREAASTLRLQGEVLGQIQSAAQVNVAIVASPEWTGLQARIVAALAPFPDARAAVAAAIEGPALPSLPAHALPIRATAPAARRGGL